MIRLFLLMLFSFHFDQLGLLTFVINQKPILYSIHYIIIIKLRDTDSFLMLKSKIHCHVYRCVFVFTRVWGWTENIHNTIAHVHLQQCSFYV